MRESDATKGPALCFKEKTDEQSTPIQSNLMEENLVNALIMHHIDDDSRGGGSSGGSVSTGGGDGGTRSSDGAGGGSHQPIQGLEFSISEGHECTSPPTLATPPTWDPNHNELNTHWNYKKRLCGSKEMFEYVRCKIAEVMRTPDLQDGKNLGQEDRYVAPGPVRRPPRRWRRMATDQY